MKQLLLIIIACVITSCSKTETPDCQSCYTQLFVENSTGWYLIEYIEFEDCRFVYYDEDRTSVENGKKFRRVTKCVKN